MPETLKIPVSQGLRPEADLIYDLQYQNDCANLYLNKNGTFEAEKFTRTAFGLDVSAQVFVTRAGVYVLTLQADSTDDILYSWDGNSLTALVSNIPSVSRANLWSCADFGDYVLFTNGTTILVRNITSGAFTIANDTFFISNWICAHRGRLILANPLTDYVSSVPENLISCDTVPDTIYRHALVSEDILSSFDSPFSEPSGLAYTSTNLVSCDSNIDKIYEHDGLSDTILNSFNSPSSSPSGLTIVGANLISCDRNSDTIYIHDGISDTILDSFDSPSSYPNELTYIGGNLISCDAVSQLFYEHIGVSDTISNSFSTPSTFPSGITNDGTNLISCDRLVDTIYIHDGISDTILESFDSPAGLPNGLTMDTTPLPHFFVLWSKINELKFQEVGDPDISNLSGYMPLEYSGSLLRVEPLKQHIIVYGEDGISALTLAGTRGYGMTTLHHTGIKDAGSVCLNGFADGTTAHYFIDTSGELYVIDASLKVTRIGYKELFSAAHTADPGLIRMSYNIRRDEVLINFYGSDKTFIFSGRGLTSMTGDVESFIEKGGTRYISSPAAITQSDINYETNTFDMDCECQKYLWGFSAKISAPGTVKVVIDYRTTRTGAWTSTSELTFDKARGYINLGRLTGVEFKINIIIESYTTFQMSDIVIKYSKINGGAL